MTLKPGGRHAGLLFSLIATSERDAAVAAIVDVGGAITESFRLSICDNPGPGAMAAGGRSGWAGALGGASAAAA